MNILCLSLICIVLTNCNAVKTVAIAGADQSKKTTRLHIAGTVKQTSQYCGGARPTREMEDKLSTPVPYPGKNFYIRAGKINDLKAEIVKDFTTDQEGNFSFDLPQGVYAIILEEQLHEINAKDYKNKDCEVDENCLSDWWKKPYYLLEIKDQNIDSLNFIFNHRCFLSTDVPCISYKGVMPH